jgi:hypothetical protein
MIGLADDKRRSGGYRAAFRHHVGRRAGLNRCGHRNISYGSRTEEERPVRSEGDDPIHPKRAANPAQPPIYVGDKKLKKLQRTAWEAGWWPEPKKNGIMWLAPDGSGQVMLHGSSSDHHAHDTHSLNFARLA